MKGRRLPPFYFGADDRTRLASAHSADNCFAPSSRREQQSTGLLHLGGFASTMQ